MLIPKTCVLVIFENQRTNLPISWKSTGREKFVPNSELTVLRCLSNTVTTRPVFPKKTDRAMKFVQVVNTDVSFKGRVVIKYKSNKISFEKKRHH